MADHVYTSRDGRTWHLDRPMLDLDGGGWTWTGDLGDPMYGPDLHSDTDPDDHAGLETLARWLGLHQLPLGADAHDMDPMDDVWAAAATRWAIPKEDSNE